MTRREALRTLVLAAGGGAAVAGVWWSLRDDPVSESELVRAITDAAKGAELPLADGVAEAFVADYERHLGSLVDIAVWKIPLFHRFLLSTTAFSSGRAADEPVIYAAFYDPFISPCLNPIG